MPKPNKENIITAILEELANNGTFELTLTKFNLSRPTFAKYWKIANERYAQAKQERQKAIDKETTAMAVNAAKKGLKSRIDYCMEIQKLLDEDRYEESVLDLRTGKVTRFYRKLTPLERKALYERISKFEGMDAASKSEVLLTKLGKDLADEDYV